MKRGLAALGLLALVGGCGLDVDMAAFEGELEAAIADEVDATPEDITVNCPEQIDWEPGNQFRCFAEDQQGTRAKVTIYMENDEGEYSWELN